MNCIDENYITTNNLWWDVINNDNNVALLGIGDHKLTQSGIIYLSVKLGESNIFQVIKFHIIGKLGMDFILGFDFLHKNNCALNLVDPACVILRNIDTTLPLTMLNKNNGMLHNVNKGGNDIFCYRVAGLVKSLEGSQTTIEGLSNQTGLTTIRGCDVTRKPPKIVSRTLYHPSTTTPVEFGFKKGNLHNRSSKVGFKSLSSEKDHSSASITAPDNRGKNVTFKQDVLYKDEVCLDDAISCGIIDHEHSKELISENELIIPALSETTLSISISQKLFDDFQSRVVCVEPLPVLLFNEVLVAASVHEMSTREMPIRFLNFSKAHRKIAPKTTLAYITEINNRMSHSTSSIFNDELQTGYLYGVNSASYDPSDENWINQIKFGDLNSTQKEKLISLLQKYHTVFSKNDDDVGHTKIIKAKIQLNSDKNIFTKQYPLSKVNLDRAIQETRKLYQLDIIEESNSPYNSPVLVVPKAKGGFRLCLDFRKINLATIDMSWPIPSFEMASQLLSKNKFFSSLDLNRGFLQVELDEQSRKYTAFTINGERYQFSKLPFGCKNSSIIFQQMMSLVLKDLQYTRLLVYIDDLITFSETFDEHLVRLEEIFIRLKMANLKLKSSKCHLADKKVQFLGHVISEEGFHPNPNKSKAIREFGTPQNKKELRSFLGLCNFFRRFVDKFSLIASPLYELTSEKMKFIWQDKHEVAFNALKKHLTSTPILQHPRPDNQYILMTDASTLGLAAILMQEDDEKRKFVISYFSRKLKDPETRYPAYDLELLSLVEAVDFFRMYLEGVKFKVIIDCCPLKFLMTQKNPSLKHWRWISRLQDLSFSIFHQKASEHSSVDCLSRDPRFKIDRVKVSNNTVNLLERIHVDSMDVMRWKETLLGELNLYKCNDEPILLKYKKEIIDSFYEAISNLVTHSTENSKFFQNIIAKFIIDHKKYVELSCSLNSESVTQFCKKIKEGKQAEILELNAVSSLLHLPIVFSGGNFREVILPSMKTRIEAVPPHGAVLHIDVDSFGNLVWTNPDLCLKSENINHGLIQKSKPDRIFYPQDVESEEYSVLALKNVTNHDLSDTLVLCRVQALTNVPERQSELLVPSEKQIMECQKADPYCIEWTKFLLKGILPKIDKKDFLLRKDNVSLTSDGLLIYTPREGDRPGEPPHRRIILPQTLLKFILFAYHDHLAHIGRDKTVYLIQQSYHRPYLFSIVAKYIKACARCKNKSGMNVHKLYPIQRMPLAQNAFEIWHMDYAGPYPRNANNNKFLLIFIDSFTRWIEVAPCEDQTATTVAQKLIEHVVARFGCPLKIISDRGGSFYSSKIMQSLYEKLKITPAYTLPYHPQSNGSAERSVKTIINGVRSLIDGTQLNWEDTLPYVLMAYRATIHSFTNESPFYMVYGRSMNLPVQMLTNTNRTGMYALGLEPCSVGTEIALRLSNMRDQYLKMMSKQALKHQVYKNRQREPVCLKVGDPVLMKKVLRTKGLSKKLHNKFVPGFKIIKKHSDTAFTIQEIFGRRKFKVNAENIIFCDDSFQVDLDNWYQDAQEMMAQMSRDEVTDPLEIRYDYHADRIPVPTATNTQTNMDAPDAPPPLDNPQLLNTDTSKGARPKIRPPVPPKPKKVKAPPPHANDFHGPITRSRRRLVQADLPSSQEDHYIMGDEIIFAKDLRLPPVPQERELHPNNIPVHHCLEDLGSRRILRSHKAQ